VRDALLIAKGFDQAGAQRGGRGACAAGGRGVREGTAGAHRIDDAGAGAGGRRAGGADAGGDRFASVSDTFYCAKCLNARTQKDWKLPIQKDSKSRMQEEKRESTPSSPPAPTSSP